MDTIRAKELAGAATKDDVAAMRALLDSDRTLAQHPLPFAEACKRGNVEAVSLLVRYGADVNTHKGSGPRGTPKPLFWTVWSAKWSDGHRKVAEFLLDQGADIDAGRDEEEVSPLIAAAERGHQDAVDLLIRKGASVGFYEAVMLGDTDTVAAELAGSRGLAGACRRSGVGIHNVRGTSLHFAAISALGNTDSATARRLADIAEVLIENGAPVNGGEFDGERVPGPAAAAARSGNVSVIEVVLRHGADPDEALRPALEGGFVGVLEQLAGYPLNVDAEGDPKLENTLLHEMVRWGKLTIAVWLIDQGADVMAVDCNGWTPLHYAARRGTNPDFVEALITRGASLEAKDGNGATPLDISREHGRKKLISFFEESRKR